MGKQYDTYCKLWQLKLAIFFHLTSHLTLWWWHLTSSLRSLCGSTASEHTQRGQLGADCTTMEQAAHSVFRHLESSCNRTAASDWMKAQNLTIQSWSESLIWPCLSTNCLCQTYAHWGVLCLAWRMKEKQNENECTETNKSLARKKCCDQQQKCVFTLKCITATKNVASSWPFEHILASWSLNPSEDTSNGPLCGKASSDEDSRGNGHFWQVRVMPILWWLN